MKRQIKNLINKPRTAIVKVVPLILLFLSIQSCEDTFLDVVPDNVATIDNAFQLRNEAEKYLSTCYSYLPQDGNPIYNIGMLSGDEIWIPYETSIFSSAFEIARGNQRITSPYMNVWDGYNSGGGPANLFRMFIAIRHCNIFIENISNPNSAPDLTSYERERWIGEVEFLKAYYHYYLLRMYGPIPIIDKNIPIDASEDQINVARASVDDIVTYIIGLLDTAVTKLPSSIVDRNTELGRITKPIALAIKAKVLVMAASPLFNGNTDFSSLVGKDGTPLFNASYDETKWQLAADAALVAIESATANGHGLYEFPVQGFSITDETMTQMSIRQAVCERWNSEVVWGNSNSTTYDLQRWSMPPLDIEHNHNDARKILSPPLKMAKLFYSENGVPINEDASLNFSNIDELRIATNEERFNIEEGFTTARINFDREPRFYASLGFDGAIWYKYDSPSQSDDGAWVLHAKFTEPAGATHAFHTNETGYFIKKLVDWNQVTRKTGGASYKTYAWPQVRLADLYLMYAEALNEATGPSAMVYNYLDLIRDRAGLDGVITSWQNFSTNPSKPSTKEGLREIIQQERLIELSFEGHRFWDLRRWKRAAQELNSPITGWNIKGENNASYYQIRTVFQQTFVSPRDYFWPIPESAMLQNPNLIQNVGW